MPVFASSCLCITMARLSAQLSTRSFRTSRGAYSYFICVSFSLPHFPSFTLCFFAAIPLNLLGPLPSNSSTVLFLRSCRAQQRAKNGSQSFLFCSLILPFPHHTLSDLVPFHLTPESQSCTALLLLGSHRPTVTLRKHCSDGCSPLISPSLCSCFTSPI